MRPNFTKNESALVVTTSEIGNQFMLAIFSKSVALRTKVPFNKSEVIALQVQFAWQFGLIDGTLHLHSPLGSPCYKFRLNCEWYWYSDTLSTVHGEAFRGNALAC